MGLLWKSAIVASQKKLSLIIPVNLRTRSSDFVESMKGQDMYLKLMETLKNFEQLLSNPNSSAEVFSISNLCRTGFREVDFGWGKSIWSFVGRENRNIYGSRVERIAWLMDTKSGDGIEAWVNLKEDDMATFEKNPELLAFASLNPSPLESQVSCV
ncbi:BAHD acyltransferase At5g47980-like [Coffea eugenioides]|uniref:BAHD acyltransferase At5g47980-like n=1 Tax=Coffea eugenioides TaxID=49369 RepID=UPI000F604A76|nr:BAHD acyltransferase At5g47980-like [Coffea eugenioides]